MFLEQIAEKISRKFTEPFVRDLDWGPIHGDATLDNLHVTDDAQIVLYDFDLGAPAGGPLICKAGQRTMRSTLIDGLPTKKVMPACAN